MKQIIIKDGKALYRSLDLVLIHESFMLEYLLDTKTYKNSSAFLKSLRNTLSKTIDAFEKKSITTVYSIIDIEDFKLNYPDFIKGDMFELIDFLRNDGYVIKIDTIDSRIETKTKSDFDRFANNYFKTC